MSNYLVANYFADEYRPDKYPQKLRDFLIERYFKGKEKGRCHNKHFF